MPTVVAKSVHCFEAFTELPYTPFRNFLATPLSFTPQIEEEDTEYVTQT